MLATLEEVRVALVYGSEPVHFIAEPMKIGKHEWTIIVFTHGSYGRCTKYLWRPVAEPGWPTETWQPQERWSTHNGDHCDGGMPGSLRRLHRRNEQAIRAAIGSNRRR